MKIGKFMIKLHSVTNYVNDMVLLQVGIERKNRDTNYMYTMMEQNCLKPSEVFTSTTVVTNSLRVFAYKEFDMVLGNNRNKLFRKPKTPEQRKEDKKKKFAGAFVMNPKHATSTGFMLLGLLNKYIHDHVIDMDITSESSHPLGGSLKICLKIETHFLNINK